MSETERSSLSRRQRAAVLAGLGGTTAVAWAYLAALAEDMEACSEMAMTVHPWSWHDFALTFAMWAVMMVGMMLPTAAPTTLVYAAVARKAAREGAAVAPTAAFVAGYAAMWTLFSVAATAAQWALDRAALLSPAMVASTPWLGAALLALAGVYQLTPYKETCLQHCRSPVHFVAAHWRPGIVGAMRLGALHGAFCLGCCWALMGLLFFGGVMNLLWIAAIALFVLAEKVLPLRAGTVRWSGAALVLASVLVTGRWLLQ
jgi:predicted metal-binding membrane protein